MSYEIRVTHICEDFTITDVHSEVWKRSIDNSDDLTLLLNRVAIATTQFSVVEFPEVQIQWESRRVLIRAISGKLYYTEHGSSHRKDLVVVPEEILRLLEGQSVEQALHRDPEEDVYSRPAFAGSAYGSSKFKRNFLLLTLIIFGCSLYYSWNVLTESSTLLESPRFVATMEKQGELLRQYADVYVSELREGATLFQLTEEGKFTTYEMWFSKDRKKRVLIPMEVHQVVAGFYKGEDALLAGEIHVLQLKADTIVLHGMTYKRFGKKISELGEVLIGGF